MTGEVLLNSHPAFTFRDIKDRGINARTSSRGDCLPGRCLFDVDSCTLKIPRHIKIHEWGTMSNAFLLSTHPMASPVLRLLQFLKPSTFHPTFHPKKFKVGRCLRGGGQMHPTFHPTFHQPFP